MSPGAARLLRAYTRLLSSPRVRVGAMGRLLRAALLVGPFSIVYALLKMRLSLTGRPVELEQAARFGARFNCRLPDLVQMYVYLFGVWEPDVSAYITRNLEPGDTFIDVGANIGYDALLAASRLNGTGRVVAIEASPAIFGALRETLTLNGNPTNVRAVNQAAADVPGAVTIYRGPAHNIGLSTTVESRGLQPEAQVAAAPLADLLEPQEIRGARLLKIDVEGAEDLVLRGMSGFLRACSDDVEILLELSPSWWGDQTQTAPQVLKPLLDAGFHAYRIDNNLWPWRYLWPNDVGRPKRMRQFPAKRVKRIDLVLSRRDQEEL